ncbi:MAG: MinD/ParA family protein [Armatimonadetes bacterium]|nr:MinD/ParA family protein [Armatimonadota bacterium]
MKILAVASGKGGVGKTTISANLAITLAEYGHTVLVFDADLGLANVDVLLNLKPQATLKHVVADELALKKVVLAGPAGIDIIPGGSGVQELVGIDQEQLDKLIGHLASVMKGYDYVIFDTASGLDKNVIAFLLAADRTMVVCTPDPTSIMDAYATTKSLFAVRPDADVALLVNMADDLRQGEVVFNRLKAIVGQFLNKEISFAGCIAWDHTVIAAARARESFVLCFPKGKATEQIDAVAERVFQDEIETDGSEELSLLQRLRAAFRFFRKTYDDEDELDETAEDGDEEERERPRREDDDERPRRRAADESTDDAA